MGFADGWESSENLNPATEIKHRIGIVNPSHENKTRLCKIITQIPATVPSFIRYIYNTGKLFRNVYQAREWCENVVTSIMMKHSQHSTPADHRTYTSMCIENLI